MIDKYVILRYHDTVILSSVKKRIPWICDTFGDMINIEG